MILTVNAGSSSIKFQVYKKNNDNYEVICKGLAERIGIDGHLKIFINGNNVYESDEKFPDHSLATNKIISKLKDLEVVKKDFSNVIGIGHRIVHGGERFTSSTIIDDDLFNEIKKMSILAPLHNPPAIAVLDAFRKETTVSNVAVFDTSYHTSMPKENYLYSVPYSWYRDYQVRRYGFHGISYRFIVKKLSEILAKPIGELNAVVCHLGNGASVCAIKNGLSHNTSMGLTPLEGLIMGTRSGDIDPSIIEYINARTNWNINEITNILNKKSGLLGISEVSSDMRDVSEGAAKGDKKCKLALQMAAKRVAKYIVSYANEIGEKLDAIVFTAGIGENSPEMRKLVADNLSLINLDINEEKNNAKYTDYNLISNPNATCPVYAIRTDEELMICYDVDQLVG